MKKKWQEIKKCNFAIKVTFDDDSISFRLYDRNDHCLRHSTMVYPMTEEIICKHLQDMYSWADKHCGNNGEWIYVHNPYWMECRDIIVG